jgi:hypothetical protein
MLNREHHSPWTSLLQENREIKSPQIKVGLQYSFESIGLTFFKDGILKEQPFVL